MRRVFSEGPVFPAEIPSAISSHLVTSFGNTEEQQVSRTRVPSLSNLVTSIKVNSSPKPSLLKSAFVGGGKKETGSLTASSDPRSSEDSISNATSPHVARQNARARAVFEAVALAPAPLPNPDAQSGGRIGSTELSRTRDWSKAGISVEVHSAISPSEMARISKEKDHKRTSSSTLGKEVDSIPTSPAKKSKFGKETKSPGGKIANRIKAALSSPQKTFSTLSNVGNSSKQGEKEGVRDWKPLISSPTLQTTAPLTKSFSVDSPTRIGTSSFSNDLSSDSPNHSSSGSSLTSSAKNLPRKIVRRISSGSNFVPSILKSNSGSGSKPVLDNLQDEPEWEVIKPEPAVEAFLEQEILNSSPFKPSNHAREQRWVSALDSQAGMDLRSNGPSETRQERHHRNRSSASTAEDFSVLRPRSVVHTRSESASAVPSTTVSTVHIGVARSRIVHAPLSLGPSPSSIVFGSRKGQAYEPSHSPIPESLSNSTISSMLSGLPSAGLAPPSRDGPHLGMENPRKKNGFAVQGLGFGSFGRGVEPPSPIVRARLEEQQSSMVIQESVRQQAISQSQSEPQLSRRPVFRHTTSLDSAVPTTRTRSGSITSSKQRPGLYQSPSLDGVVVAVPTMLRGSVLGPSKMSLPALLGSTKSQRIVDEYRRAESSDEPRTTHKQLESTPKTRTQRAPTLEGSITSFDDSILSSDSFETNRYSAQYTTPFALNSSQEGTISSTKPAYKDRDFARGSSVVTTAQRATFLRSVTSVPDLASINRDSSLKSGLSSSHTVGAGLEGKGPKQFSPRFANLMNPSPSEGNRIKSAVSALAGDEFNSPAFKTQSYVKAVQDIGNALLPSSAISVSDISRWRLENERETDLGTP